MKLLLNFVKTVLKKPATVDKQYYDNVLWKENG